MPTFLQHLLHASLSLAAFAFTVGMGRIDIDALMVNLPDDGEPEPDVEPSDDDEDAIVARNKDGIAVQMEEEFDVAKLCDEELLELGWGPVPQDEAAFRWGACAP